MRPDDRDTSPVELVGRPLDPDDFERQLFTDDQLYGFREAASLVLGMLVGYGRVALDDEGQPIGGPTLERGADRTQHATWRLLASSLVAPIGRDDVEDVPAGAYCIAPACAASAMLEAVADATKPPGFAEPAREVCTCEDDPPHTHVVGGQPMWVGHDGVARPLSELPADAPPGQRLAGQLIAARLGDDPDTWHALLRATVLPDEPTGTWVYRVMLPVFSVCAATFSATTLDGERPIIPDDDRPAEVPDDARALTIPPSSAPPTAAEADAAAAALAGLAERGDVVPVGTDDEGRTLYELTEQGRRRVEGMGAAGAEPEDEPEDEPGERS